MRWSLIVRVVLLVGLLVLGCSGDPIAASCVPGQTTACACPANRWGVQECTNAGTYGACTCDGDGGVGTDGSPATEAGTDSVVLPGPDAAGCGSCDDGNPCTSDTCETGQCVHRAAADDAPCGGGRCHAGLCCSGCWTGAQCLAIGAQTPAACGFGGGSCGSCDDHNPCTVDSCSPGGATPECTHAADPSQDGRSCGAGSVCAAGTCVGCGGPDQPCCAGRTCGSTGLTCGADDTCVLCGGPDQPCCNGTCASGARCMFGTPGTPVCRACGGVNAVCCDRGAACGANLGCTGTGETSRCACGGSCMPCCGGSSCGTGLTCSTFGTGVAHCQGALTCS